MLYINIAIGCYFRVKDMAELVDYCKQFSPLEPEALAGLLDASVTRTFRKGQYLLRKGEVCRKLIYINSGLVKSCFTENEKEFVMRFFYENLLFSVFDSYFTQSPSKFALVALEPTTITTIDYAGMEALCQRYHSLETFFRKLLAIATAKMTKRISEMLEGDASERYKQFVEENNAILQRINVGDIANYLGITPQSLSRIRAARQNLSNGKKKRPRPD
jgi:CRP-like cAMP-binding protein